MGPHFDKSSSSDIGVANFSANGVVQFGFVSGKNGFQSFSINFPVSKKSPRRALEGRSLVFGVVDFDFLDESIEPNPNRRVSNAVGLRQILQ